MLEDKVLQYIKKYDMLHSEDEVVVGVSGGADSVCLLLILKALQKKLNIYLQAVTVHHGIRKDTADADVAYVQHLCQRLEVPVIAEYADVPALAREKKLSEEEAGRQARYECFYRIAQELEQNQSKGRAYIAVAHHQMDNCETILHHLLRGSGLKGLSGIAPVRDKIIRPLLDTSRVEIEQYLKERHISWQTDETNTSLSYTRNKIRRELIPYMQENINASAVEHILQASEMIRQADDYFAEMAEKWIQKHALHERPGKPYISVLNQQDGRIYLPVVLLIQENEMIRHYIYRKALADAGCPLKDVTRQHIESVDCLCQKDTGEICLPAGGIVCREYEYLKIYNYNKKTAISLENQITLPVVSQKVFSYNVDKKIPQNVYTKWLDYDKIKGELQIRTRQKDDYIEILSDGSRKKLKKYMIDSKIPKEERNYIPLVADGSHILWIIGYRISEGCKVTKDTRRVVELKVEGAYEEGMYE